MITQKQLKAVLDYCPETGVFRWAKDCGSRAKRGNIAGSNLTSDGYVVIRIRRCGYTAHRLAYLWMTGSFPAKEVDHINGIRDDNRWYNLREVDRVGNTTNTKRRRTNTSGVTGVTYSKNKERWVSRINVNKRRVELGQFKDFDEAVRVRREAEKKYGYHPNHGRIE